MNEFCKHSEKIQVLSTYSQFEIGLYQLYTILDILYFFYTVFLHVFSHESHRCLKAFIFHKQHRGLEILIIPKQLTLEMATHQGDSVIHALVCISKGKKKKLVCFLILKKILHVAGFGEVIKVEQLISKLRPLVTLGRLLTSGPDFAIYSKGWIVR